MTVCSKPASGPLPAQGRYALQFERDCLALRVRACVDQWRQVGASSHVLSWINEGVPVEFNDGPPPAYCYKSIPLEGAESVWWEKEKLRLQTAGAIETAQHKTHVSRAFLVPKKTGGYRLVVNLKPLNPYCVSRSCRYESLKVLQSIATPDAYMFSMDLQDGYHCLSIRPEDRRYVTFELGGETFQCAALPFGWCNLAYCESA